MPFRDSFQCLWCGTAWTVRGSDDLEGWAQLCPTCLGKAGENPFLRTRLRAGLAERSRGGAPGSVTGSTPPSAGPAVAAPPAAPDPDAEMVAYYAARAGEYDDWYRRRGRYSHGPIHDAAWDAELDAAGRWLDGLPFSGEIAELAAGTGWWSPLLAEKGELWAYDASEAPLDLARERLLAHSLRAHLHVRDAWAEPDRLVNALFCGFWLSHIPRGRLEEFLRLVRRWLKPGGLFAFIDSLPDPQSGAADNPAPGRGTAGLGTAGGGTAVRRLADGREFRIVKVFYRPDELRAALLRAGFAAADVTTTGRFFLLGRAEA